MAATIVTIANNSYAYPNAVLLHHQLGYFSGGNLRESKRRLEQMGDLYRRLVEPVCSKIGMTQEQFVDAMYAHDPDGNWSEFADGAARLKWVGHVVRDVREEGVSAVGDARSKVGTRVKLTAPPSDVQQSAASLPPLGPFDAWFLYEPSLAASSAQTATSKR